MNTDVTAVVRWGLNRWSIFTNTEPLGQLADLGNYTSTDGVFNGKKVVPESEQFLTYLRARPRNPSPSTLKLPQDIDAIIHANQPMTRA